MHIWSSSLATLPSMWHLREDWQRLHARLQHNILLWIGRQRLDDDSHTNTDTIRQVGLLFATTNRATICQDASASDTNTCINEVDGSLRLRLFNEKSDVIRPYYSLRHRSRSTSSTMYCIVCKLNVSTRALRLTTVAKICLRTDCCNASPPIF